MWLNTVKLLFVQESLGEMRSLNRIKEDTSQKDQFLLLHGRRQNGKREVSVLVHSTFQGSRNIIFSATIRLIVAENTRTCKDN